MGKSSFYFSFAPPEEQQQTLETQDMALDDSDTFDISTGSSLSIRHK